MACRIHQHDRADNHQNRADYDQALLPYGKNLVLSLVVHVGQELRKDREAEENGCQDQEDVAPEGTPCDNVQERRVCSDKSDGQITG